MKIKNPEEELKSTTIWLRLSEIDNDYAEIAINFINNISTILSSIKDIFPYYTRHDAHHGFRVLLRMQQILDKRCFISKSTIDFSKDELLLLICAAYAHDLGMAVFPNEEKILIKELNIDTENWQQSAVLHNFLRLNHSNRGGVFISEHNDKLGLPQNLIFLLHKLMEAHNLSINELDIQLGKRFAAGSEEINLKQLACILCIADAIEFSETRVVDGVLDILKQKLLEANNDELLLSYRHNMQHICIGDSVAVGDDGKIIISGTFNDPDTMSLAHNTIDFIEKWLRNYIDIDFQSPKKRLIIRADSVIKQLNIVGYDFERIGIRLKKENVIDLISSNATWTTDTTVVLRELLQNSVEACRYRKFHSPAYYEPEIKIHINSVDRIIEIKDNGCGMSRNIILNNFLTIANSRSEDPSYTTIDYSSLARFGIGFWSVFTISNMAYISTGPFEHLQQENGLEKVEGVSFEVSIEEFKDYTVFKPILTYPGTSIKLQIKPGVNIADMVYKIPFHIGCSEIPITINYTGETKTIPPKMSLPSIEEVFGSAFEIIQERNVKEYIYTTTLDEVDLQVKLFYTQKGNDLNFTFPKSNHHILSLQDRSMLMKFRGSGICGFLFNHHASTELIDLYRIGYFCSNALNPRGFKFTLNRMGVMDSPQYEHYKQLIQMAVHDCYRNFLKSNNSLNAETICKLNHQSRLNGGENRGAFTGTSLQKSLKKDADLIAFKLYKIDKTKQIDNCEVLYLYYDQLIKMDLTLWLYHIPYYSVDLRELEKNQEWIYNLLKIQPGLNNSGYLLERTREADMIADNAPNGIIDASLKILSNITPLPLRRFKSNDIDPTTANKFVIGIIKGSWAGTLEERPIENSNFISLNQHHFIVKTGSELASDIKEMLAQDLVFKVAELINLLTDTTKGQVHESVKKYLFEQLAVIDTKWEKLK